MNMLDAKVTKILSKPEFKYGKYFVKIEYECYGVYSETSAMFNTLEDAMGCNIGFITQV